MTYIRLGILGIALVWGALNLVGAIRRMDSPASCQTSLLASASGIGIAAGLIFVGAGQTFPALFAGGAGIVFGLLWFAVVYRQSLHNTTM